ncbi:MAG: KTSC domain-containing protein [Pseudomonadota bacterium]
MSVLTKTFTSSRIRKAEYDTATKQLDLHWDNKSVLAYKQVPEEVYRRLCSAPNPATYWEDRIAEEYPKGTPRNSGKDPDGGKKLSDLFGGGDN